MTRNGVPEEALTPRKSALQEVTYGELSEQFLASAGRYMYGPQSQDPGLKEFWRSLQRHKLLMLAIVGIITGVATFVVMRTKATYTAASVIEIGKDNAAVIQASGLMLQNEESEEANATAIKTKMVLMKSQELLEDVIVNLQLDRNPKFFEGVNQWSLRKLLRPGAAPGFPVLAVETNKGNSGNDLLRSPAERARLDPYVRVLEANLNIEQIKETRALKVSFVHTDPAIAAAVADGVAQNFIQRTFKNKTERFTNTADWLSQSTEELKTRVKNAEQALANYTRENNIFTTEGASTLTTSKLASLHDQVTRAESDRILKETLYEEVRQGRVTEMPEVFAEMTSKNSPRILELQKQLGELTTSESQLKVHYGPSNPQLLEVRSQIVAIQQQIEAARKLLNEKLRTEYEHAVRDEASLKTALVSAKSAAVSENQAAIQSSILKQEVETAKALYTEFLQKSNQTKIQVAEQFSSIRIVDHAKIPVTPSGPQRGLNILLWFTISLLLAIGIAFMRDFLDSTLKNSDDIAQYLQLSTLAVIPLFKTAIDIFMPVPSARGQKNTSTSLTNKHTGSEAISNTEKLALTPDATQCGTGDVYAAEAYRALRTSVLLSTPEGPPKTILVTSCEPGDGKTTTVVNLALSLCELNSKILIIDADMRRPRAHRVFGVERSLGLSTYLSADIAVNRVVKQITKASLSLLSSGPIPPTPASLLSSPKMKRLLEEISPSYDYILIDAPPLGSVSDAVILSSMVDGVLLVVKGGKSRRELVNRAKYDLMNIGAKVIGVVLNGIDPKQTGLTDYPYVRGYYRQPSLGR